MYVKSREKSGKYRAKNVLDTLLRQLSDKRLWNSMWCSAAAEAEAAQQISLIESRGPTGQLPPSKWASLSHSPSAPSLACQSWHQWATDQCSGRRGTYCPARMTRMIRMTRIHATAGCKHHVNSLTRRRRRQV